jgi:hypothetical protein
VTHICNPSYSGGRDKRIVIPGWPRKKKRPNLKNKLKTKGPGDVASVIRILA